MASCFGLHSAMRGEGAVRYGVGRVILGDPQLEHMPMGGLEDSTHATECGPVRLVGGAKGGGGLAGLEASTHPTKKPT